MDARGSQALNGHLSSDPQDQGREAGHLRLTGWDARVSRTACVVSGALLLSGVTTYPFPESPALPLPLDAWPPCLPPGHPELRPGC